MSFSTPFGGLLPGSGSGAGGQEVVWNLENSIDGVHWTNNGQNTDWNEIVKLFDSMIKQANDRWWRVIDSNGVVDQAHNFVPKGKVVKHVYLIQKCPNEEGLVWTTVYEDADEAAAEADYATAIAQGGWWQMLVDGVMTKTNLPIEQRYEAQQKKKAEEYLRDVWSVEALIQGTWSWLADADTLAGAKAKLAQVRAGTLATIGEYSDLRIVDKTGAVVYTDKGKVPQIVFWSVEQSPTADMTRWVLRSGPYNTYGEAKSTLETIIKTEPIDILRIVDTTGKVYDTYKPKTGAEAGPMAGMTGLMVGIALVLVLAGMRAVME